MATPAPDPAPPALAIGAAAEEQAVRGALDDVMLILEEEKEIAERDAARPHGVPSAQEMLLFLRQGGALGGAMPDHFLPPPHDSYDPAPLGGAIEAFWGARYPAKATELEGPTLAISPLANAIVDEMVAVGLDEDAARMWAGSAAALELQAMAVGNPLDRFAALMDARYAPELCAMLTWITSLPG